MLNIVYRSYFKFTLVDLHTQEYFLQFRVKNTAYKIARDE